MSVTTPWYLLALPVASVVFALLPGAVSRRVWFTILSLGFLWSQLTDPFSLVILAAFLFSGFAAALLLRRHPWRILLAAYIVVLVAAFIYLKQYAFLELLLPASLLHCSFDLVGLSYMLFRQIHFLVDVREKQITELSLPAYLNYQLDFFSLQAGPIQRYQNFQEYWSRPALCLASREDVLLAYFRVFIGYAKIVLAGYCLAGYEHNVHTLREIQDFHLTAKAVGRLAVLFYAFPIYVFLNFSGYCDMVIGGASLLGLKLPENFNHPYLARNMIDFWERWHITLSMWIRDYLFTPLYIFLAARRPAQAWLWAVGCYLVAFFLAGVWHGASYGFMAFGLFHGVGVSATKLWETLIIQRHGRAGLRQYLGSRPLRYLCTVVTFHFACATFLVFPGGTALIDFLEYAGVRGSFW